MKFDYNAKRDVKYLRRKTYRCVPQIDFGQIVNFDYNAKRDVTQTQTQTQTQTDDGFHFPPHIYVAKRDVRISLCT